VPIGADGSLWAPLTAGCVNLAGEPLPGAVDREAPQKPAAAVDLTE
jgi:hypothetical protein